MRLSEVKKAMNMKCAMNKLCGGGDTAKKTRCEIKAFSVCKVVAFLSQSDHESDLWTIYVSWNSLQNTCLLPSCWKLNERIILYIGEEAGATSWLTWLSIKTGSRGKKLAYENLYSSFFYLFKNQCQKLKSCAFMWYVGLFLGWELGHHYPAIIPQLDNFTLEFWNEIN